MGVVTDFDIMFLKDDKKQTLLLFGSSLFNISIVDMKRIYKVMNE